MNVFNLVGLVLILVGLIIAIALLIAVGRFIFYLLPHLKKSWLSKQLFVRKWLFYQFFGLGLLGVIVIALHIPLPIMMGLEDSIMDEMMDFYRNKIPPVEKKIPHLVLLDIDTDTHTNWGDINSIYTPLDKLTNLIDVAVRAKARLIIVDIDLAHSTEKPLLHAKEFEGYLRKHAEKCKENPSVCSPLLLARTLSDEAVNPDFLPEPHIGIFENVVTQSYPYVQWGSAEWSRSVSDNMTRRWRLWEPICTKEQPKMLPSIEVLVMGMVRGCTEDIQNVLRQLQPKNCNQGFPSVKSVIFCGLRISTNIESVQQRIMYRMPYSVTPKKDDEKKDDEKKKVLTILSAQPYAEPLSQYNLEAFPKNSIVVIGASFGRDKDKDIHSTPIGDMPGALVLSNAIYSLLQDLTIKPMSFWWLFIAFFIIITLFSSLPEQKEEWQKNVLRWSGIFLIILILGGLFFYSVILFKDGTWLSIAVPIAIIEICRNIYKMPRLRRFANQFIGVPTSLASVAIDTPDNINQR